MLFPSFSNNSARKFIASLLHCRQHTETEPKRTKKKPLRVFICINLNHKGFYDFVFCFLFFVCSALFSTAYENYIWRVKSLFFYLDAFILFLVENIIMTKLRKMILLQHNYFDGIVRYTRMPWCSDVFLLSTLWANESKSITNLDMSKW